MIAIDSKSYPYLAVAQYYGIDYGEVLKRSENEILAMCLSARQRKDDENNNQITREIVGIKNEREELLAKVWWNAAIEKAANCVDNNNRLMLKILKLKVK